MSFLYVLALIISYYFDCLDNAGGPCRAAQCLILIYSLQMRKQKPKGWNNDLKKVSSPPHPYSYFFHISPSCLCFLASLFHRQKWKNKGTICDHLKTMEIEKN